MAYSEEILRRARARLELARTQRRQEQQARQEQAYARYPRLREIDRELRLTMSSLMANVLRSGEDSTAAIAEIREQNLALQRERDWILQAGELAPLDEGPACPLCGDTGYVGAQMCSCLHELCRQEQRKELTSLLHSGADRFEDFRLDVYPDAYDPELGTSPRRLMQSNFNDCRKYAASFSSTSPSLLFSGGTGLGKTFLSACIARQVADSGFGVIYETATRLFADFEAEKFAADREENRGLMRKYLACDLLIIDDLGTEMTTQFTVSALYTVVNDRMMAHKPTILSTNLTDTQLEARYSPQIASRLLGTYRFVQFAGEDIRRR